MWPFGNKNTSPPPIQNLDRMDVAAKRKDGTVDCTIVVSSRLEATTAHQQLLTEKIKNYLKDIHTPEFVREFEQPKLVRIVIFLPSRLVPKFWKSLINTRAG